MVLGERHKPRAGFFLRLSELSRRLARGTGGEGGIRNIQNSNALSRISFWSHKSAYISWDPSGPQVAARNIGREIRDDGGPQMATTRHSSRRGGAARLRRERPLPAHCRCCGFCADAGRLLRWLDKSRYGASSKGHHFCHVDPPHANTPVV